MSIVNSFSVQSIFIVIFRFFFCLFSDIKFIDVSCPCHLGFFRFVDFLWFPLFEFACFCKASLFFVVVTSILGPEICGIRIRCIASSAFSLGIFQSFSGFSRICFFVCRFCFNFFFVVEISASIVVFSLSYLLCCICSTTSSLGPVLSSICPVIPYG